MPDFLPLTQRYRRVKNANVTRDCVCREAVARHPHGFRTVKSDVYSYPKWEADPLVLTLFLTLPWLRS